MNNLLLAYYGDDFTGSTDALEFISNAGGKAMLFIKPPDADTLKKYPDINVVGIAGLTRALATEELDMVLRDAFKKMKAYNARHIHYKVCSTFDSSPTTGSIGRVIDIGKLIFENDIIPVIGGTPSLGRYCVFGNLFARMGIGSNGAIYRLDRHPSMSKHPTTPAYESDLRLHLQEQTNKKFGLIDVTQLQKPIEEWCAVVADEEVVLVDALYEEQLVKIGEWLDDHIRKNKGTLFTVGSSAVEMALGFHWNNKGYTQPKTDWPQPSKAEPLLVLSGSYSPVTATQIKYAIANGFVEVPLEMEASKNEEHEYFSLQCDIQSVFDALHNGKSVIIHSRNIDNGAKGLDAYAVGRLLGSIGKGVCEKIALKRIVVAGGDTSSYAARAMDIEAVEVIALSGVGAPLCKVHSSNPAINGIEVNFKGGQVGSEDYFIKLKNGNF
ncbi:MAG: four-carbon acid sugar kinase family protein [Niabella sp.]